jgi:hypothetical protein
MSGHRQGSLARSSTRWLSITLLLGGCAQLAGIDETSGGGSGAGQSLTFERVSIGATVVKAPADLFANGANYLIPDAVTGFVRVSAALVPPDRWTASIRSGTPAVQFDLPDDPTPQQRIFELPNAHLLGSFAVLEHPARLPAPVDATLTVSVTLDAPYAGNESLQLFTAGSWNTRALDVPVLGATQATTPTFPFTAMTSTTGRPHEMLTTADAIVILKLIGNQLVGTADVASFDQTGNESISGTIVPVVRDQTLDIVVDQTAIATRLSAVRPAVSATPAMSWSLRAAPGADYAIDTGPLLHAASVSAVDPGTITAMYGNPFVAREWRSLLTWVASATRSYTPPALGLPVTLRAQMFQRALPSPALALELPAGLPELISLDGMSLSTDGLTIPASVRPVVISFVTDRPANTMYALEVFELVPNEAMTGLVLKRTMTMSGVSPTFTVPGEVFVSGKHYTVRASAIAGGFPNIASGDMQTRSLPFAQSFLDSGVFQVTP